MSNAEKPYKRNGSYTARWAEPLQMFVAEQLIPDGPLYCTRSEYDRTAEAQAFCNRCREYRRTHE